MHIKNFAYDFFSIGEIGAVLEVTIREAGKDEERVKPVQTFDGEVVC